MHHNFASIVDKTVESHRVTENNSVPKSNRGTQLKVHQEFRIILNALAAFGNCPLSYDGQTGLYHLKIFCWRTAIVFGLGLVSAATWINYTLDFLRNGPKIGSRVPFDVIYHHLLNQSMAGMDDDLEIHPEKMAKISWVAMIIIQTVKACFFLYPLSQILDMIFNWTQAPLLAQFLNNWTKFEAVYSETFSCLKNHNNFPPLCKSIVEPERDFYFFKMRLTNFMAIFATVCPGIACIVQVFLMHNCLLQILLEFNVHLRLGSLDSVEDTKNLFMCREVADAFGQIRFGIVQELNEATAAVSAEEEGEESVVIDETRVKSWRDLMEMVRDQCDLMGRYQSPSQLFFILRSILAIMLVIFLTMHLPEGTGLNDFFRSIWRFYALVQVVRLTFKCWMAEWITSEEGKILEQLYKIDMTNFDAKTVTQIQFAHDSMTQRPTRVSYGNYVILNTRLILSIFRHVSTYLIVMMQFVQSK